MEVEDGGKEREVRGGKQREEARRGEINREGEWEKIYTKKEEEEEVEEKGK